MKIYENLLNCYNFYFIFHVKFWNKFNPNGYQCYFPKTNSLKCLSNVQLVGTSHQKDDHRMFFISFISVPGIFSLGFPWKECLRNVWWPEHNCHRDRQLWYLQDVFFYGYSNMYMSYLEHHSSRDVPISN